MRASSWTRDECYLRNHVMPTVGTIALARIDKLLVQAWVRELVEKGLHPATVKECYQILRSILNEAADSRLIVESPCRNVTLPRVPKTEQRFLTAAQVGQLGEATDPQFRALVYSAVYLGCRWGELVGLKRVHLNLLKREARIVGTLQEVPGGVRYVEETRPVPVAGRFAHRTGVTLSDGVVPPVGALLKGRTSGPGIRQRALRQDAFRESDGSSGSAVNDDRLPHRPAGASTAPPPGPSRVRSAWR